MTSPPAQPTKRASGATPDDREAWQLLYYFADLLDDIEGTRIASENRLRTLFDDGEWGKGLDPSMPKAKNAVSHMEALKVLEHGIILDLKRAMRAHPLGGWCKRTPGVGEKQLARLLAVIGDPAEREKPSQLWAYCGLHVVHHIGNEAHSPPVDDSHPGQAGSDTQAVLAGVAPTLTRGQKSNWSTEAKTRIYLVAESTIKMAGTGNKPRSPYRDVYDEGRVKYADAVHSVECRRCGPKGSPAQPGSDLSDGHKHARAMRLVMKRILLDIWKESRGGGEAMTPSTPKAPSPTPASEHKEAS